MSADPLTMMIRHLNQSVLALATIGGTLGLRQTGQAADPLVAQAMQTALAAMGAPPLDTLDAEQNRQALGLIRTFFVEAADLLDHPGRQPGWAFEDPAILQSIGASSAGMVARMSKLAATRPWFADVLSRPGTFLDVGTGVGGLALAAAEAWHVMDVIGIDRWAPSLALADLNRAASTSAHRVRFEARSLEDVDDDGRYALVWLPTPFITGPVVRAAIPRLHAALQIGGGIVVGVVPPPPDPLGAALGRLRAVRNGGQTWSCDEMAELLDQAGFVDIEVPENQAGVHFVLGQRKRETAPTLP